MSNLSLGACGSVAKNPDGVSEVVNDLDGDLINFWRVMADEAAFGQFQRRIEASPFSEAHWQEAQDTETVLTLWIGRSPSSSVAASPLLAAWTVLPRLPVPAFVVG